MSFKTFKPVIIGFILVILCFLYVSFLRMDFFNIKGILSSNTLKYISILFCVLITLMTGKAALNTWDISLLHFGLIMTALADLCLLLLDYFTLGVIVFCIVQITYCIRYIPGKAQSTAVYFSTVFFIIVLGFLALGIFIKSLDILIPAALFYSICLITSVYRAIYACRSGLFPSPNRYLIAVGMICFLFCDINVALFNISKILGAASGSLHNIADISSSLMWFFYLPSQVMLALSGYDFKKLFTEV